jgi:hypothetical protein
MARCLSGADQSSSRRSLSERDNKKVTLGGLPQQHVPLLIGRVEWSGSAINIASGSAKTLDAASKETP